MTATPLWEQPKRATKVLVVDDEENIAFLVASALRLGGSEVTTVGTGLGALAEADRFGPDLIVLDVMMPDIDGFEVLRRLRQAGNHTPVLFLSARDGLADKVQGLTSGGDDYIVKPFALEELLVRVEVALRRSGHTPSARLRVADLELDDAAYRVWRAGAEVQLSPTEFKLLRCLMANVGRVVTRAQILEYVWQYDFDGESAIIETFISYLRKKVDAVEPKLIHTVRGVGYSLREPPSRNDA